THHPIFFKPVQRVTAETWEGAVILKLAAAGCAVYSAHTAWDDAPLGINARIANAIDLERQQPLRQVSVSPETFKKFGSEKVGQGCVGKLREPLTLDEMLHCLGHWSCAKFIDVVLPDGRDRSEVFKVAAIGCGAGGSLIGAAMEHAVDVYVTGELRFHEALSARSIGLAVILLGHYHSEWAAMSELAEEEMEHSHSRGAGVVWVASSSECNPINREFGIGSGN
ncbi:MAG: Nif3-like dinuclear metal center hexameric protein, partial [Planctomycetota bacterium]